MREPAAARCVCHESTSARVGTTSVSVTGGAPAPSGLSHCGAGLVSSRTSDTCVACGGSGERVGRGAFGRDDVAWAPRGDIVPEYAYDPLEYEPIEVECPDWLSAGDLVPFSTDDGDRIEVVAPEWARSGGTFWVAVDASGEWAPVRR